MSEVFGIVLYVFIFLAVYVQVFFLLTFLKSKKILSSKKGIEITEYPSIGIIVPCWNEENSIGETISYLLKLDYPKDKLFIHVVDDGSIDNTWNVANSFSKIDQVKVFRKENGGKHTALNFALEKMETELVCSIDADTFVEKGALLEVVKFLEDKKDLAAVGCTVLINRPKTFVQKAQSIEYQLFSFSKKMLGILDAILVAPGAFSVFKTDVLKQIGGWIKGHSMEDIELTFRLHKNGFKSDHCHTAIAHTKSPESIKKLFKQRLRWSYGFMKNTHDYKSLIFNPKLGNFGAFTIPTGILAYFTLVFIFFYSWYRMSFLIYEKITTFSIMGWEHFLSGSFSFNWFFIDTKAISFLSLILISSILISILLGRRISGVKGKVHHIGWYFLIYSFLQPIWIIYSVFNYFFAKKVAWR